MRFKLKRISADDLILQQFSLKDGKGAKFLVNAEISEVLIVLYRDAKSPFTKESSALIPLRETDQKGDDMTFRFEKHTESRSAYFWTELRTTEEHLVTFPSHRSYNMRKKCIETYEPSDEGWLETSQTIHQTSRSRNILSPSACPGPLFTRRWNVFPPNLAKSRCRQIRG